MNKDKINKEKKEKAKNIAFKILHGVSYALSTCFIATCIVACASSGAKSKSDNSPKSLIQYRIDGESESQSESESVSYPIYDDENYKITLNSYQLNNYVFNNLCEYLNDIEPDLSQTDIDYGNRTLPYEDFLAYDTLSYAVNDTSLGILYSIKLDISDTHKWFYGYEQNDNYTEESFIYDITFNLTSSVYESFKQAIQLDIQLNSPSNATSDIFTAISDTITNFVIALNSGITAIVGLFWNSTSIALTPLGVLTTIVVGVALAYFVFRLIIGLIRLRG